VAFCSVTRLIINQIGYSSIEQKRLTKHVRQHDACEKWVLQFDGIRQCNWCIALSSSSCELDWETRLRVLLITHVRTLADIVLADACYECDRAAIW
jgi:hypothetical protein